MSGDIPYLSFPRKSPWFKIVDPDRFATVMEFALAAGVADKLIKRLEYLARYGDGVSLSSP
ncbi:hypothetical protein CBM2589_U10156 [Cupriavidus taiwanensis]|uniref:Uncharacterized protein n=1 Tax=Cupriavidus taiwanensis TaxID=164546 RepID=A0A375CRC6_9BURK|nr:hypothetical protein CBM2589_U10156 [Cupriavidus taiwanensis]